MKKLAVIGVGMIGSGVHGQGIPAMVKGLEKLSEKYKITVYSFIPVDKTKAPKGIRVRCIWSRKKGSYKNPIHHVVALVCHGSYIE